MTLSLSWFSERRTSVSAALATLVLAPGIFLGPYGRLAWNLTNPGWVDGVVQLPILPALFLTNVASLTLGQGHGVGVVHYLIALGGTWCGIFGGLRWALKDRRFADPHQDHRPLPPE